MIFESYYVRSKLTGKKYIVLPFDTTTFLLQQTIERNGHGVTKTSKPFYVTIEEINTKFNRILW